eukprot:5643070-Pleurochrysis_carterae.AAC.9
MRHATREGNKPSFWTYLRRTDVVAVRHKRRTRTIQHVLSGGCEATGRKENIKKYRGEMRRI